MGGRGQKFRGWGDTHQTGTRKHMGVEPKKGVGTPPNPWNLFIGFFHEINHPFWGFSPYFFGNTHIPPFTGSSENHRLKMPKRKGDMGQFPWRVCLTPPKEVGFLLGEYGFFRVDGFW